jgi:hypothetical protein
VETAIRVGRDRHGRVVVHRDHGQLVDVVRLLIAGPEAQANRALGRGKGLEIVRVGIGKGTEERAAEGPRIQHPVLAVPAVDKGTGAEETAIAGAAAPAAAGWRRSRFRRVAAVRDRDDRHCGAYSRRHEQQGAPGGDFSELHLPDVGQGHG